MAAAAQLRQASYPCRRGHNRDRQGCSPTPVWTLIPLPFPATCTPSITPSPTDTSPGTPGTPDTPGTPTGGGAPSGAGLPKNSVPPGLGFAPCSVRV